MTKSTLLERSLLLPSADGISNGRRFLLGFLQEGHHLAERFADGFDGVSGLIFTHLLEVRPSRFIFRYPLLRECTVLNLCQDLLHRFADAGIDDSRTTRVVAVFGCVADRITQITPAALIERIDN